MKKTFVMLFTAAFAALSLSAAEAAKPAEKPADKPAAKAPAKKAPAKKPAKKYVMPADGGLKDSTTATPRQNPKKKSAWNKRYADKVKQIAACKMMWTSSLSATASPISGKKIATELTTSTKSAV